MSAKQPNKSIEPVPDGSSILALPFISAVAGLIQAHSSQPFRVALHRAMTRSAQKYLQQVTPYAESSAAMTTGAGRIFDVDLRFIGNAFTSGKVWRTRHCDNRERFEALLASDMKATGDTRSLDAVGRSWLAVPFVVHERSPALVLYAESVEFNFFANDERVKSVVGMSVGFARLLDALQVTPISAMRNYPLGPASDTKGNDKAYPNIHESLDAPASPQLAHLESFNFEMVGP